MGYREIIKEIKGQKKLFVSDAVNTYINPWFEGCFPFFAMNDIGFKSSTLLWC